jgi:hypothetical protein
MVDRNFGSSEGEFDIGIVCSCMILCSYCSVHGRFKSLGMLSNCPLVKSYRHFKGA